MTREPASTSASPSGRHRRQQAARRLRVVGQRLDGGRARSTRTRPSRWARLRASPPVRVPASAASQRAGVQGQRGRRRTAAPRPIARPSPTPWPSRPKPVTSVTACGSTRAERQAPPLRPGSASASARWRPPCRRRRRPPARCRCRCGFDSTSTSPGWAPALVQMRSGWTRPCTASPKIGSSERMVCPPATTPPASAHDSGRGDQDRRHRLRRHALGEGRDVERQHDPAPHGEHVAARVGRGDGAEVGRIVDERREEIGGRNQRQFVRQFGRQRHRRTAPARPAGRTFQRTPASGLIPRAGPPPTSPRTPRTTSIP